MTNEQLKKALEEQIAASGHDGEGDSRAISSEVAVAEAHRTGQAMGYARCEEDIATHLKNRAAELAKIEPSDEVAVGDALCAYYVSEALKGVVETIRAGQHRPKDDAEPPWSQLHAAHLRLEKALGVSGTASLDECLTRAEAALSQVNDTEPG